MTDRYLCETGLLDYSAPTIRALVESRGWESPEPYDKIGIVYNFVRDEIAFGYNADDALPASRILAEGYGQCNTKGVLFMALLRAVGLPCRIHGFYIDKALQKGAMTGLVYRLAPRDILHSWVEVYYDGRWTELEGFILDRPYLSALQAKNPGCGAFCGYGAAVRNLQDPPVDWHGEGTYIQSEGITRDLGIYASPDELFALYRQKLSPVKGFFYSNVGRRKMNANIARLRSADTSKQPPELQNTASLG